MVPFKKILSQIMNGLHTNHFCSMGTIMKFVINMEGLDADLELVFSQLPMPVEYGNNWLLDIPWAHVLRPLPEDAVERARRRRLRFPQKPLEVGPSSCTCNVGPGPHQALKDH
jgi:hypothetical protein